MERKACVTRIMQCAIIGLLCAAVLCGCGEHASEKMPDRATDAATEKTTESTVNDAEKRVLPSPHYYFHASDSDVEADIEYDDRYSCLLFFDEYPKLAAEAYRALLTQTYGLVESSTGDLGGHLVEYPGTVYFLEPDSAETCVKLYWCDGGEINRYLMVEFSKDCRLEKLERWEGDVGQYGYDPEDWRDCGVCGGTGKCRTCYGDGTIREYDWDSWKTEDCPDCSDGKCPAGCTDGKVRIHP